MATAGNSTPRSALRTINAGQDTLKSQKGPQIRKPGLEAPSQRLLKAQGLHSKSSFDKENAPNKELQIFVDPKPQQKVAVSKKEVNKVPEPLPEKEFLHIYNPEEDLRPYTDTALIGIISKIKKWRPACMYGVCQPDTDIKISDDDDDNIDIDDVILEEPKLSDRCSPLIETDLLVGMSLSPDCFREVPLEEIEISVPEIEDFPFIDENGDYAKW